MQGEENHIPIHVRSFEKFFLVRRGHDLLPPPLRRHVSSKGHAETGKFPQCVRDERNLKSLAFYCPPLPINWKRIMIWPTVRPYYATQAKNGMWRIFLIGNSRAAANHGNVGRLSGLYREVPVPVGSSSLFLSFISVRIDIGKALCPLVRSQDPAEKCTVYLRIKPRILLNTT